MNMEKLYNEIINAILRSKFMQLKFMRKITKSLFVQKLFSYEFVIYVVFGVLTTLVNFVISFICNKIFGYGIIKEFTLFSKTIKFSWVYVTNIISWVGAVLFAYFTNKAFVFEVKDWSPKVVAREMVSFFSARIVSLLAFDLGFFAIVYNIFIKMSVSDGASYWIAKIAAAVFTVLFNYVFSKFIIFKKNSEDKS